MFKKPKTIYKSVLDELEKTVAKSPNMSIITGEEMRGYVGSSGCKEFPFSYCAFEWRRDHCKWGWSGGFVRMESGTIVWKDSLISSGSYSSSGSGSGSGVAAEIMLPEFVVQGSSSNAFNQNIVEFGCMGNWFIQQKSGASGTWQQWLYGATVGTFIDALTLAERNRVEDATLGMLAEMTKAGKTDIPFTIMTATEGAGTTRVRRISIFNSDTGELIKTTTVRTGW